MSRTNARMHLQKAPPHGTFALNRHKNTFLIAAAVLLVCGAVFVGGAAGDVPEGVTEVSTPEGLTSAVTNDFNVKLTGNIELTETLNITKTGVLDLNGYVLSLKSGTNGSVIKVESSGKLTLTDNSSGKTGRVAGGKGTSSGSSLYGGGVFVNGGTFTMSGGSICDNTAQWGGGVCVREGGMFAMSGGTISGNKATTTSGGSGGGGVDVENGTFTMSGGSIITSNEAKGSGGGVYVNDSGTFNMTGGSITSNDAGSGGGGVYGKKESTFRVSGAPVIKNNKKGSDGNNVYLKSNAKITIDDALTSGAEIWVTPDTAPTSNSSVAITAESSGNYSSYFKSDNSAYGVANTGTGDKQVVKIGILYTVTFEANGHGTAPDSQSVLGGEKVTEPETPTAEGYTFGGWYENPECTGNAWNFETGTITGNKTLYAKWEDAEPTITVEQTTENPVYGDAATVTYDVTISDFASAPTLVFAWNGGSSPQDVSYTVPTFTTGTETKQLTITTDGTTPANLDGYGFTLSDNAGHSAGGKLVVGKKPITIDGTNPATITKTYDGLTDLPDGVTLTSSGVDDGDTVTFIFTGSYDNKNVRDSKTVNFTGIAFDGTAGDNGNYTLSGTTYSSTNGKIETAPLTVTANDNTITYGDAPANDGVTYTGFVGGESESVLGGTLSYDYSYTQYGDVGNTYTITPKGLSSTNYNITFATGKLTVAQKSIANITAVSSGKSSISKEYDGKTTLPTDVVLSSTDIVNSDAVTINYDADVAKSHYDDKTAQTGKTVTISGFSLSGTKSGNYTVADDLQITLTNGEITKKSITINGTNPAAITKTYDGLTDLPDGVTLTSSGVEDGDTVTFTFTGSYDNKNVGDSKTVNFTNIAIAGTGADNGNYALSAATFSPATGKITQRPLSDCTIDAIPDQTFTGSPITPDPVVKYGNLILIKGTDYTVSYADNTAIGTATVTINPGTSGNYSGTNSTTFKIVAGQNTVTLNPQGGIGGTASVTASYGQPMPQASMPTKSGYTFNGYYDAQSGGTQYYKADGSSAKNWDKTADTTLYAQWTANTYTVTPLSADHGSISVSQTSAVIGTTITVTGTADPGYYLSSLTDTGASQTPIPVTGNTGTFTMPASDVTIEAVFMPNKTPRPVPPEGGEVDIKKEAIPLQPENRVFIDKVENVSDTQTVSFNAEKEGLNVPDEAAAGYTKIDKVYTIFQITVEPSVQSGEYVKLTVKAQLSDGDNPNNVILRHYKGTIGSGDWESRAIPQAEKPEKIAEDPYNYQFVFNISEFSPFALTSETPVKKSSSSPQGSSIWLTATPTPTVTPTPTPTGTPGSDVPTVKPVETKQAETPVPFMGILAGLGCAAVLFGLRRK